MTPVIRVFIRAYLTLLRVFVSKLRGVKVTIGHGCYIAASPFFSSGRTIKIGNRTYIGRNASLSCHLNIGDDVLVASYVSFVGGDHQIDNINVLIKDSGRDLIKVVNVQSNVWIGHGAIIMHGVTLHAGCVVAAGAVVTKDVPSNAVVGGNPAKFIRYRKFLS